MRIIDAKWEEKNIGVTTAEIVIDINDAVDEVSKTVSGIDNQYVVCKVLSGRTDVTLMLQDIGFKYIEDQIEFEHDLHEIKRSRILQRLYDSLPFKLMDEEDIKVLYEEIDRGMFDSDRISLDPFFSKNLSANRYKNWIAAMIERGAYPYVMSYKGEPAGFVILTTEDGVIYHSVLGGGYEKFRGTGLGIVNREMEITKNLGGKKLLTSVSSNNANQLKVLVSNGYVPRKVEHVLIKHN